MPQDNGLTIRQHKREDIDLALEFVVCDEHQQQVKFSPMSSAIDPHVVPGRAIDISTGGMGLRMNHFVPRMSVGNVRVYDPEPSGQRSDGTPTYDIALEARARVRRIEMIDHGPTYKVGVSLIDPSPELQRSVVELKSRMAELAAPTSIEAQGTDDA